LSAKRPPSPAPARILFVEFEATFYSLLANNLEAEGFVVNRVDSGDQGEFKIAHRSPSLVILDGASLAGRRPIRTVRGAGYSFDETFGEFS
jgi:DNA-binding response OmpR family regulator